MPSKNVVKTYVPESYYHVYNRGVAKLPIFLDAQDKKHFLKIIQRHLDPSVTTRKTDGTAYRKFNADLELLCYCLMRNHFHLLFYLKNDTDALRAFMQSALTAYTMYFNKRHKRVGTLFQGVFKAALISNDAYLLHISRYIHLNPRNYKTYYYSSLKSYCGDEEEVTWIKPKRILDLFDGKSYQQFVDDYAEHAAMLDVLKHELADF